MNKRKIIIALIVPLLICCFYNTNAKAKNTNVSNEYETLIEELEMAKKANLLSRSTSTQKAVLEAESKIEGFKEHIYSLKNKSNEELSFYGYNESQIEAIKTYDGSSEMSTRASAIVTATAKRKTFTYNSSTNITTIAAEVTFTWSGIPAYHYTNAVALGYEADNNHNFQKITTASGTLTYKEFVDVDDTRITTSSATKYGDTGINGSYAFTFPVRKDGDVYATYLSSGVFTATGKVSGDLSYFNFRYLYAYKTSYFAVDFGISISNPVSGSINLAVKDKWTAFPTNGNDRYETFEK